MSVTATPKSRKLDHRGMSIRTLKQASEVLRVIAHPIRLKLLELLLREQFAVHELAEYVGQMPHVVSQHLNLMKAHGIVQPQRRGKQVFYEVKHRAATSILRCIAQQNQLHTNYQDGEAI